ncbi:MAG: hypothetical protein KGM16_12815 [Bacteroidota bacterium]|nr:hypothetical protein [Bacteroidota bacterium]
MKKIIIPFLLFLSTSAFCQDSYISNDGQTVNGQVLNYKEWSKNPAEVKFQKTDGSVITLTPENCGSFVAGTDKYLSYHGTRVANTDNVLVSRNDDGATMIKDTVNAFLRQVYQFDGYTLFELFDNKRINFYLNKNGNIKELEYYETIKDGTVDPNNSYKAYLYHEFAGKGIKDFQVEIKKLRYNENDLENFFANVLGDQSHTSEKLRNKYPSEILLGVGANVNSGTMHSWTSYPYYHQTTFSPSVEFGLRLYSQRNFGKFFFQPTIGVMPLSNTFKASGIQTKIVKATEVNVAIGAGYMFLKKQDISVYADGAALLCILANYETKDGDRKYVGTDGSDARITGQVELGVIVRRNLNIFVRNSFPIRIIFPANTNYTYKMSQLSLAVRYAFIHGHKK